VSNDVNQNHPVKTNQNQSTVIKVHFSTSQEVSVL